MLNTEYPGAHACVSTAAAHALRRFFRSDDTMFPMDGIVNGVTYVHTFNRYTDAGAEARAARITAACTTSSQMRRARGLADRSSVRCSTVDSSGGYATRHPTIIIGDVDAGSAKMWQQHCHEHSFQCMSMQ